MSREKLLEARNLIHNKCYDDAAAILRTLPDDPQAQKWMGLLKENKLIASSAPDVPHDRLVVPQTNAFERMPTEYEPRYQPEQEAAQVSQTPHALRNGLTVVDCVALGSVIAVAIAGFWVYSYLHGTVIGWTLLWDYVVGDAHGSDGFVSTEALFVVIVRFLLGFGLFWGPSTLFVFFGSYVYRTLTQRF